MTEVYWALKEINGNLFLDNREKYKEDFTEDEFPMSELPIFNWEYKYGAESYLKDCKLESFFEVAEIEITYKVKHG